MESQKLVRKCPFLKCDGELHIVAEDECKELHMPDERMWKCDECEYHCYSKDTSLSEKGLAKEQKADIIHGLLNLVDGVGEAEPAFKSQEERRNYEQQMDEATKERFERDRIAGSPHEEEKEDLLG